MPEPTPPAHSDDLKVTFPLEHVLLLTLNRPSALNAMSPRLEADLSRVLAWFDTAQDLWVCVLAGAGKLFCAGADLKAWNDDNQKGTWNAFTQVADSPHGFGALSRRNGATTPRANKPLIAAVVGGAYGGGVELLLGCDLVVASETARFALPEVKRGVVAAQGGIPNLVQNVGRQFASEMLLLGRTISAVEARDRFRFVNKLVPEAQVIEAALAWAHEITQNSPDAVRSSKRAILCAVEHPGVEDAFRRHLASDESKAVYEGENMKEGVLAFTERRTPKWKTPARL